MAIDLNSLNSSLQSFAGKATKPTNGEIFSTWLNKSLSDSFGKIGSSISSGLKGISSPISSVMGGITGITGIASALGSDDKTIKTIGVADSGVQVAGAVLDKFVPGAGTALNAVNSIGGKLIGTPEEIKDFSVNQSMGSGFGGIQSTAEQVKSAGGAYSQAGLAGKMFAKSGLMNRVANSNTQQSTAQGVFNKQNKLINASRNTMGLMDLKSQQRTSRSLYNNPNTSITIGKKGMVIKPLPKFQNGGQINIIVDGSLHSRKHNLKDLEEFKDAEITEKGVIVISKEGGTITQHAEVEVGELILNKEVTEKLNDLFKKNNEESQIEAGKILSYEIMKNTKDNKEKIIKNA